MPKELKL
jgi:hypothetical protein